AGATARSTSVRVSSPSPPRGTEGRRSVFIPASAWRRVPRHTPVRRHARSIRRHLTARRLDTELWHLWTCLFGRCCRRDFPVPRCLATANLKTPPGDELGRHRRGRRPCLQEQQ